MKRLITILIIFQAFLLNAQTLTVTGSTQATTSDPCMQTHTAPVTVKNVSSDTVNVLCEKIIVDTATGTSNFFCWGSNCYGSSTYISSDYNTLDPGEGDHVDFGGYYDAYCALETATIEYCFFPDTDPTDRTCITITYNGSTTSIVETVNKPISDFYPNPAKEVVHFNYLLGKEAELSIMDILGKEVKRIKLTEKGHQKIDITGLLEGIYFGNLIVNNEVLAVKKIIKK